MLPFLIVLSRLGEILSESQIYIFVLLLIFGIL